MDLGVSWEVAAFIFGFGLIIIMATGIPVAFAFGLMNLAGAFFIFGSLDSLSFLVHSARSSVENIFLSAIPFFVLMGTIFVHSRLSTFVLDQVGTILAGVRGSGAYTTVAGGAILGALMGASVASTTVLGTVMVAELRKRHYTKFLSAGCIVGAGTLAILIPPSMAAVLVGSLAGISIADLLLAGIGPAIVLTVLLVTFVFIRVRFFEPDIIDQKASDVSTRDRMRAFLKLTPLMVPVFSVTGVIYFGVATATEASSVGAVSTLIVAYAYSRFGWRQLQAMILDATVFTAMIFFIVMSSKAYGQIFAILGISQGFMEILSVYTSPVSGVIAFLAAVLVMGCFMDAVSVIFVSSPIFLGALSILGVDPIWFGAMFIMAVGTGAITPPFGLNLFALKSVAPPDFSMADIYKIAIPIALLEIVALIIVLNNPFIVRLMVG